MTSTVGGNCAHGLAYVVAENAQRAYDCVRKKLDAKDLGFAHQREMASIELIAEAGDYPDCGHELFLDT